MNRICPDCLEAEVTAEQYHVVGCCQDCERKLLSTWSRLDQDYYARGGE